MDTFKHDSIVYILVNTLRQKELSNFLWRKTTKINRFIFKNDKVFGEPFQIKFFQFSFVINLVSEVAEILFKIPGSYLISFIIFFYWSLQSFSSLKLYFIIVFDWMIDFY